MRYLERLTQLPPTTDPVQYFQVRALRVVVLSLLAIGYIYIVLETLLLGLQTALVPLVILLVYTGFAPFVLWLARRHSPEYAARAFVVVLWLLLTVVVVLTGGALLYPSISYYSLVIVAAALLVGWQTVGLVGSACAVVTLARLGWLLFTDPAFTAVDMLIGLAGVFAILLTTSFLTITVRYYRRVALQAHTQSHELAERNNALQDALDQQQATRDELAQLFEHSLDLMLVVHVDTGAIVQVSPSVQQILGWKREELIGTLAAEIIHPDDRDRIDALTPTMKAGGRVYDFEVRYRHRDGGYRVMSWNGWYMGENAYGVARDLTSQREMIQREGEIQLQQERLRTQGHFISVMYHELKTPLTVMNLSADIIASNKLPEAGRAKHLNRISSQVKHMNDLVNETLRLRRLIDPSYPLEPQEIELQPLMAGLAEEAEGLAEQQTIDVHLAPDVPQHITTDPDVLRHVLMNLLTNAIKYSDDTVDLNVTYQPTERRLQFSVHDRGIGIAPEDVEHVFEPFFRADNAQSYVGTGLGLAIARDGVMKIGGSLHCESEPGAGTTFHVLLPAHITATALKA